jgi:hypothetical protein
MSIGNLKTDGGKGTNWPWQYKMLLGLDKIAQSLKDGTEFESELVTIDCSSNPSPPPSDSDIVRLEVRVWDTDVSEFTSVQLYEVGSATPDTTDYSGCVKTYLSGDATEATLEECFQVLKTIKTDTAEIISNQEAYLGNQSVSSSMLRPTTVAVPGTNDIITDSVKSISFYNASATVDAQINADGGGNVALKPGETINFDAGGSENKFTASTFTYDPDPVSNAGDLLIIYVL